MQADGRSPRVAGAPGHVGRHALHEAGDQLGQALDLRRELEVQADVAARLVTGVLDVDAQRLPALRARRTRDRRRSRAACSCRAARRSTSSARRCAPSALAGSVRVSDCKPGDRRGPAGRSARNRRARARCTRRTSARRPRSVCSSIAGASASPSRVPSVASSTNRTSSTRCASFVRSSTAAPSSQSARVSPGWSGATTTYPRAASPSQSIPYELRVPERPCDHTTSGCGPGAGGASASAAAVKPTPGSSSYTDFGCSPSSAGYQQSTPSARSPRARVDEHGRAAADRVPVRRERGSVERTSAMPEVTGAAAP